MYPYKAKFFVRKLAKIIEYIGWTLCALLNNEFAKLTVTAVWQQFVLGAYKIRNYVNFFYCTKCQFQFLNDVNMNKLYNFEQC